MKAFLLALGFLFLLLPTASGLAQPSQVDYIRELIRDQPPLTAEEVNAYCDNVKVIIDLYDPDKKEAALYILNMTADRFKYVDLKINTYAMMNRGFIGEQAQAINSLAQPTIEEEKTLEFYKDKVLKANNDLIKLLTFGLK